jgi:hypothetical protein
MFPRGAVPALFGVGGLSFPLILIWLISLAGSEWAMVIVTEGLALANREYRIVVDGMWIITASGLTIGLITALTRFSSPKSRTRRTLRFQQPIVAVAR